MTIEARIQLTSSELGTLWMTYMSTCANLVMCESLSDKTIDNEAKKMLTTYIAEAQIIKDKIVTVFNNEKASIPTGFDQRDIILEAPTLFDDIFKIMFLRQMMKLNLGHSAIYTTMSYMKEVQDIFKLNYYTADKFYVMSTSYLLGKGVLAKPPYVSMPKIAEVIEGKELAKKIISKLSDVLLQSDIQPTGTWAGKAT